ncbi:MAG: hypothetical protein Q9163_003652, partial [Psora crenata]
MCKVEIYNLLFPDGHSERREQVVNTCPRGTPSVPCHRRDYVYLQRDRLATPHDIDEHARPNITVIEPARPQGYQPKKRQRPKGVWDGLSIEFTMWNPFSSKPKAKAKPKRSRKQTEGQLAFVEPIPRAPSPPLPPPPPPPRYVPRDEPIIIESAPRRERRRPAENEEKSSQRRRWRRRPPPQVVLHHSNHSSDEEEEETPSPSESTRMHVRPRGARSLSPMRRAATTAKASHDEQGRHRRAEQADHEAHVRAERRASAERRSHEKPRQQRDHHRIEDEERRGLRFRLESAEKTQKREAQEEAERAEQARRRQERVDMEALQRAQRFLGTLRAQHEQGVLPRAQPARP